MEVAHGFERMPALLGGSVVSIGNFDVVHRGHVQIVAEARQAATRLAVPVTIITFEPHPLAVLAPERAPATLTVLAERLELLAGCGVERALVLRSEPALLSKSAEDFLASLVAHCRPRAIVEGPDFNFGRGRAGSIETLRQHAARWGFEVHAVPAVRCEALKTRPHISSSSIRQALVDGRIGEANAMLGRRYRIAGTVGYGQGRGAALGFPTVNLEHIPHLLPQHAVYAAVAQLESGDLCLAAVNIGPQPTFDQDVPRVEAHILDHAGDVRGQRVGLHFLARLREQVKFSKVGELIEQLQRDVTATRALRAELDEVRRAGTIKLAERM